MRLKIQDHTQQSMLDNVGGEDQKIRRIEHAEVSVHHAIAWWEGCFICRTTTDLVS